MIIAAMVAFVGMVVAWAILPGSSPRRDEGPTA